MPTQAERDKTIRIAKKMYVQAVEQAYAEARTEVLNDFHEQVNALSLENKRALHQIWQHQDALNAEMQAALEEAKQTKEPSND